MLIPNKFIKKIAPDENISFTPAAISVRLGQGYLHQVRDPMVAKNYQAELIFRGLSQAERRELLTFFSDNNFEIFEIDHWEEDLAPYRLVRWSLQNEIRNERRWWQVKALFEYIPNN